jgi:hypothetical protein
MNFNAWTTGWHDLTNIAATTGDELHSVNITRAQAYARDTTYRHVEPSDEFDGAANTLSFLLTRRPNERSAPASVGTIRLSVRTADEDPLSTPCSRIFGPEVARHFSHSRFLEMSRLAIVPSNSQDAFRFYLALMQNGARVADECQCDVLLAPTIAEHTRLYFGMGFQRVTEPRPYYGSITCCLLALDWQTARRILRTHRRFHRLFADWNLNQIAA